MVPDAGKRKRDPRKHTTSEKLLRLIYDFRVFKNPADLDAVVFIGSKFKDFEYNYEDFEFVSLKNIKSRKLGWEIFKLNALDLIKLASICLSEKGQKYVEKNLSDIDFSTFAKAMSSIGKSFWGWLATFYYIESLSKSDQQIKKKLVRIYAMNQEQHRKIEELDQKLRLLIT